MKKTSITDLAKNANEKDNFGIEPFEKGLISFIENTNTPITIALQGEWGSGKTSLMNSLEHKLTEGNLKNFHSVWLNTWEYALMKETRETLIDIITGLIKEVTKKAKTDETKTKKMFEKVVGISKTAFKFMAKTAADRVAEGASGLIDAMYSDSGNATIGEIRSELEGIIAECIQKDNKEGFIFFIDDLDRIDPPVAVELLELLKNIFTLNNCVFVLAIDYDVVIKGLEPKFGKLTEANEREFRSFFDKIIQVPFSMPVGSYIVNDFVKESLGATNYLLENQLNNKDLIIKFSEIANLTVGNNPRALKRLMNSLSLIKYINSAKGNDDDKNQLNEELELLVNFALVSIQIAYPPIYRLLAQHSAFDTWDNKVALQMNLKELDETSKAKLSGMAEFDEEWEQVVFRICENDHYLKKKAINVSDVLNKLKKYIVGEGENIEDVIGAVISLSSVTSLEANDKQEIAYHKGDLLKEVGGKLFGVLSKNTDKTVEQVGKRIQSNLNFKIAGYNYTINSIPFEGAIRLQIVPGGVAFGKGNNKEDLKQNLENANIGQEFDAIAKEYDNFRSKYNDNITTWDLYDVGIWKNVVYVNFVCQYKQSKPQDFYSQESIDLISNYILKVQEIKQKIIELSEKINL